MVLLEEATEVGISTRKNLVCFGFYSKTSFLDISVFMAAKNISRYYSLNVSVDLSGIYDNDEEIITLGGILHKLSGPFFS